MDRNRVAIGVVACTVLALGAAATGSFAQSRNIESDVLNQRSWPRSAMTFERTNETPPSCLPTADLVYVVNDQHTVVFMTDGKFYYNQLQRKCPGVPITGQTMNGGFGRSQICEGVTVTLGNRIGGSPGSLCTLGKFEPVRLVTDGQSEAAERQSDAGRPDTDPD